MTRIHDVVGIGVGPFNLSIAALADGEDAIDARFLEAEDSFAWHPGMMLPDVRLQMSPLKDLVLPVDPTSPHTFLNYLVEHGRLYEWLHADLPSTSRKEFEDYMGWIAEGLDSVTFGDRVAALTHDQDAFTVHIEGQGEPVRARAVVLGTGQRPSVPACAEGKLGELAFHSSTLAGRDLDLEDRAVAVVGGGQSGAEIVEALLDEHWGTPARIDWVTRRPNFQPLDEVAFTNEYFTPAYVEAFHELDSDRKRELVAEQKLASDGISPEDLRSLYRRLYEKNALEEGPPEVRLLPGRELVSFRSGPHHRLGLANLFTEDEEPVEADVVIFATGYDREVPDLLDPLAGAIETGEHQPFRLDEDFRVRWEGPDGLELFAVNAGRYSHGIAEPQMSLMAWRAARILNGLQDEQLFDLAGGLEMVHWQSLEGEAGALDARLAPSTEPQRRP